MESFLIQKSKDKLEDNTDFMQIHHTNTGQSLELSSYMNDKQHICFHTYQVKKKYKTTGERACYGAKFCFSTPVN